MDVWNFRLWIVSAAVEDVKGMHGNFVECMKAHMTNCWDNGAWNTVWSYYNDAPSKDLHDFLKAYFNRYYKPLRGGWVVINPSAAVVALCRELV